MCPLQSTVRDVSKLVSTAMQSPLLRKIVSARYHTVKVRHISARTSASASASPIIPSSSLLAQKRRTYPFTIQWENSNQLLGMIVQANHKFASRGGSPLPSPKHAAVGSSSGVPRSGSQSSLVDSSSTSGSTAAGVGSAVVRDPQRYVIEGVKTVRNGGFGL